MTSRVFLAGVLFAPLLLATPQGAHAQDATGNMPVIEAPRVQTSIVHRSIEDEESLNDLYEALAREIDARAARRTSREIIQKLTASGSDTIDLLMERASEAIEADNHAVALDVLDQVIALAPDYAEAWNRRATLHYKMREFGRSISDIEQVLKLEPRHFGALSGFALMLKTMGRDREALDIWYRVLDLYPAHTAAQKAVIDLEESLAGNAI